MTYYSTVSLPSVATSRYLSQGLLSTLCGPSNCPATAGRVAKPGRFRQEKLAHYAEAEGDSRADGALHAHQPKGVPP
jgi:hypothetical protein